MGEPESKDIISTTEASVVPNKRKKRRRAPVVKDGGKQGSSGPALLDFSFDVDGSSDNVASQRGRSYSKSLPLLLLGREHGLWSQRKSVFQWQQMMLTCKDGPRATFRRSALRRLAFSSLRTPVSDAILGLENKGSYVLSLGEDSERPDENGDSNSTTPSSLVLRFYSIPSPATMKSMDSLNSPLLLTIPLVAQPRSPSNGGDLRYLLLSLPAQAPVFLWMARDWRVGVALVRLPSNNDSLVLFPLVSLTNGLIAVQTFRLDGISVDRYLYHGSMKKLLWLVSAMPTLSTGSNSQMLGSASLHLPGYLYFSKELLGLRLVWFRESSWDVARASKEASPAKLVGYIIPQDDNLFLTSSNGCSWIEHWTDVHNGRPVLDFSATKTQGKLSIVGEAQIRFGPLLRDILQRRPNLVDGKEDISYTDLPAFVGELVSVREGGRLAEVVVAFERASKGMQVAAFLYLDLFTRTYKEAEWIRRSISHEQMTMSLSEWADRLAMARQMRTNRLGPYSVDANHPGDYTHLCRKGPIEPEEAKDRDPHFWRCFLDKESNWASRSEVPASVSYDVSYDSLYPDAHMFDNRAVMTQSPVLLLKSRSAPVELVYG